MEWGGETVLREATFLTNEDSLLNGFIIVVTKSLPMWIDNVGMHSCFP